MDEGKDENGGPVISISLTMPDRFPRSDSAQASRPPTSQGSWAGRPSGSSSSSQALSDGPEYGAVQVGPSEVIDLERYPATIAQTGRDRLEVTVHPQSLTQTVNQEWESEDADDSDDSEDDDAASGGDISDNPFATKQSLSSSTDEDTDAEPQVERSLVYNKLFPGQIITPSALSDETERVAALLRQEMSDDGDEVTISGTRIQHDDGTVEFRVDDVELASTSGSDQDSSSKEEEEDQLPSWETVVNNLLQVVQQLKQFAPKPGESKEDQAKHADLMKKLEQARTFACDTINVLQD